MELKVCPNGHHYDASIDSSCPECKKKQSGSAYSGYSSETIPLGATQPITEGVYADIGETLPLSSAGSDIGVTLPLDAQDSPYGNYDSKTVAFDQAELGFEPTVGWVVCIKGPDIGKDFALHYGYNYIGRDPQMSVCLPNDNQISHINHGSLIYEPTNHKFYVTVGNTTNLFYLNGSFIANTTELKAHDIIRIGATELMFVPLCGEKFDWKSAGHEL